MEYKIIKKVEFDKIRNLAKEYNKCLKLYAAMCRYNCFVSVKKAGSGHLGSSFSAMDIVVWLYVRELNVMEVGFDSPDRDIYFSSKGHDVPGLYSVFHSLGILSDDQLMNLRRFGGLDGHPDVSISGIESNTGSLGMGISKGKGMAIAKKLNNNGGRVFVLTGDGEFQEGQIYESLQTTSHQNISNITVIIDKNKFQTDRFVTNVNNIDDLEEKVSSFGWYIDRFDGHNFKEITKSIQKSKHFKNIPKFLIADTMKGKGISFLEKDYNFVNGELLYKWHSGAPDDQHFAAGCEELEKIILNMTDDINIEPIKYSVYETYEPNVNISTKEYITTAFGKRLCEIGEERKDLVVIDGDLSADCKLRDFEYKFPDRFIENGIAEQDMVSTAGGLARMGILPVVSSFASFLTSRANEQIYNNACENSKIIYACHFAGMIPAGPGKSHQSVRDISLLGAIPNMTIIQPCNNEEMIKAIDYAVYDCKENIALRMNIGPSPSTINLPEYYEFSEGIGSVIVQGKDSIIFSYGPVMLHEAVCAAKILIEKGIFLKVVNMPWLNIIDADWIADTISGFEDIYVLDDHSIYGGLGDAILNAVNLLKKDIPINVHKFGLDEYPVCGTPFEVLNYHKLDGKSLAERIYGNSISDIANTENYSSEAPQ
jgi:transketolase